MNTKINFTGSFGEYFIMSLGLMFLSALTFGLAFPYWIYWSYKYFFTKMQIGNQNVRFTGSFGEYFIMSLGLMLLSVITFGLAFPYWIYWSIKYFFTRLEVIGSTTRIKTQNTETTSDNKVTYPDNDNLFD